MNFISPLVLMCYIPLVYFLSKQKWSTGTYHTRQFPCVSLPGGPNTFPVPGFFFFCDFPIPGSSAAVLTVTGTLSHKGQSVLSPLQGAAKRGLLPSIPQQPGVPLKFCHVPLY